MDVLQCGLIMLEKPGGLGTAVADGFAENGCNIHIASLQSAWNFRECDFVVIYGPMQSLVSAISHLVAMQQVPPLVVWFTEQVPRPDLPRFVTYWFARARYAFEGFSYLESVSRLAGNRKLDSLIFGRAGRLRALGELIALKRWNLLKLVCVFSETNLHFLRRHGLPATLIPMGYHPQFGERLNIERDIDVVFLGSTRDKRRKRLIYELEDRLCARDITFVVKDGSPERGYSFGKERTTLLNRAKIMLNIMRQPWDDPVFRLLLAAPNGAMLLSERLLPTSTGPFCQEKHFAVADLSEIVGAIDFYLTREAERRQIAECAYEFVTTKLTMGKMALEVLRALGLQKPGSG